jgi:hypothetical protein
VDEKMTRPYTKEEMRKMFLDVCRDTARYWSKVENRTPQEMCDGVVFSMLNIFDGMSGGFPAAVNLTLEPHPTDKEYRISNDENWVEPGQVINDDVMLHEIFVSK